MPARTRSTSIRNRRATLSGSSRAWMSARWARAARTALADAIIVNRSTSPTGRISRPPGPPGDDSFPAAGWAGLRHQARDPLHRDDGVVPGIAQEPEDQDRILPRGLG